MSSKAKMPEPVAWWNLLKDTASTDPVHRHNDSFKTLITTEQAEAYAKAVRDEVASVAIAALEKSLCGMLGEFEHRYVIEDVKKAIRELKEQS